MLPGRTADAVATSRLYSTTRLLQVLFEPALDLRPFVIKNAEIHRVAHSARPRDQVPPQRSFFLRADSQDRIPGLLIQRVGLEFHADALPLFKRVPEHEVLRVRIDSGALPERRDP